MQKPKIIQIKNLRKEFKNENESLVIFSDANLDIFQGEKIAIIGPSGSGKSTLLSLLSGLDRVSSGEIIFLDKALSSLSEKELSFYRNTDISIIFQSFELISPFNSIENISAPLDIRGDLNQKEVLEISKKILLDVGLSEKANCFPNTLSGGEKQRVAIARALASDAKLILADEPTGSLDRKTGEKVLDLLIKEVDKRGKTLVIITHDIETAQKMDRIIEVKEKNLHERETNK
jgi:putative ABC transport system ATP-binding protein